MRKLTRILIWIVAGVPALLLVAGITATAVFGWNTVKQTVLLADTLIFPYRPAHLQYRKVPGDWPTLPEPGTALGTLVIPAVHITAPTVQGTTLALLKKSVGHYAASPLPGQAGNVVFSALGDITFRNLDHVKPGERIIFHSRFGSFVYRVVRTSIVPQTDPNIIVPTQDSQLTLTCGYPFISHNLSPTKQFIVWATPVSEPPHSRG